MEKPATILALDISSHTGWALLEDSVLKSYGLIDIEIKDFKSNQNPEKHPSYPQNLFDATDVLASRILLLINQFYPKMIVIEQTVCGRQRSSQRFLEWAHYAVLKKLNSIDMPFTYLDPSEWRKILDMRLSKDEKKNNRDVSQGKKRGRITKKHLSVNLVNQEFGLNFKLKHNDIADAINLGRAYLKQNGQPMIRIGMEE